MMLARGVIETLVVKICLLLRGIFN